MQSDFIETSSLHGLKENEFSDLTPDIKKKLVRLMARIMERAYRRGVQQTVCLIECKTIDERVLDAPAEYRYGESLDISIGLDTRKQSSVERLFMEEKLHQVGLYEDETKA